MSRLVHPTEKMIEPFFLESQYGGNVVSCFCHDNFSFVLFVWFVKIKTYLSSTRRRGFLKGLRAKCKFVEPQKLLYSSSCGQWVPGSGS